MSRPELRRLPWLLRYRTGARAASSLRRLALYATHQHADVDFGPHTWLGPRFALSIPEQGSFRTGTGVEFRRDFYCEVGGTGAVTIGDGSIFTGAAMVQCSTSITIGRRCVFGQSTMMADGNHRWRDHTRHLLDQGYDFHPLVIADNAVVMTKCTVLASVGAGSVVAAHSVVTRDVPPYCLVGGVPARVLEYFGPPDLQPAELER